MCNQVFLFLPPAEQHCVSEKFKDLCKTGFLPLQRTKESHCRIPWQSQGKHLFLPHWNVGVTRASELDHKAFFGCKRLKNVSIRKVMKLISEKKLSMAVLAGISGSQSIRSKYMEQDQWIKAVQSLQKRKQDRCVLLVRDCSRDMYKLTWKNKFHPLYIADVGYIQDFVLNYYSFGQCLFCFILGPHQQLLISTFKPAEVVRL